MDNLTHSLTGLLLSRAGLNKLSPKATWLMILAANVPDIDIVALAGGTELYFEHHRGITHALISLPVMALLPVLFVRFVLRQKLHWIRAWAASGVGVASHLLLDFTNAYGIRLLLPFSDAWPALDLTNVIDLFIWTVLLICSVAPALSRLVSSEIGAKPTTGRGWAIAGLLLVLLYDAARVPLRDRVRAVQEARIYQGQTPRRVLAFPTAVNPLSWRGLVETDGFWVHSEIDLGAEFDPGASRIIYKAQASPAIQAADQERVFQVFRKFSRALQYGQSPAASMADHTEVQAQDLLFGFKATALVDSSNRVTRSWFEY